MKLFSMDVKQGVFRLLFFSNSLTPLVDMILILDKLLDFSQRTALLIRKRVCIEYVFYIFMSTIVIFVHTNTSIRQVHVLKNNIFHAQRFTIVVLPFVAHISYRRKSLSSERLSIALTTTPRIPWSENGYLFEFNS
jgi:hypothetical protein